MYEASDNVIAFVDPAQVIQELSKSLRVCLQLLMSLIFHNFCWFVLNPSAKCKMSHTNQLIRHAYRRDYSTRAEYYSASHTDEGWSRFVPLPAPWHLFCHPEDDRSGNQYGRNTVNWSL